MKNILRLLDWIQHMNLAMKLSDVPRQHVKYFRIKLLSIVIGFLLCTTSASADGRRISVMLLDGESAGPYHNWRLTTPILKKELEETGLFDVTVVTAPAASGNFSNFKPEFARYQVVVSNLDSARWPAQLETEFEQYVRNGGGF